MKVLVQTPLGRIACGAVIVIVTLVAYSIYENHRREELDRIAFPYLYEKRTEDEPKAKYKTNEEALREMYPNESARKLCAALRSRIRDKRISDLTVRETEALRSCTALGF